MCNCRTCVDETFAEIRRELQPRLETPDVVTMSWRYFNEHASQAMREVERGSVVRVTNMRSGW